MRSFDPLPLEKNKSRSKTLVFRSLAAEEAAGRMGEKVVNLSRQLPSIRGTVDLKYNVQALKFHNIFFIVQHLLSESLDHFELLAPQHLQA